MKSNRKWIQALADAPTEQSISLLGITLTTTTGADETINVLISGFVSSADVVNANTVTQGAPLYISAASAGRMTETAPSAAGEIVRAIGHTFWNETDQSNGVVIVRFNPDNTYIEL